MRAQSDATKLRHAKREVKELRLKLHACEQAMHSGRIMAMLCLNLSKDERIDERDRSLMRECYAAWDSGMKGAR